MSLQRCPFFSACHRCKYTEVGSQESGSSCSIHGTEPWMYILEYSTLHKEKASLMIVQYGVRVAIICNLSPSELSWIVSCSPVFPLQMIGHDSVLSAKIRQTVMHHYGMNLRGSTRKYAWVRLGTSICRYLFICMDGKHFIIPESADDRIGGDERHG
jgi:hypothetical protein